MSNQNKENAGKELKSFAGSGKSGLLTNAIKCQATLMLEWQAAKT